MSYHVFILESERGRHYIGPTSNLERRVYQHNHKHKRFTGAYEIWKVISSTEVEGKSSAIQINKFLTSLKNYRKTLKYQQSYKSSVG